MKILEILAPEDGYCRPCINRTGFRGVTIHNTSNYSNGANAIAHANLLRGSWKYRTTSWNYVVDENYAVRCVPENEVAWCQGDGNGDGNMKTISIEICDNADGDIRKATDNAVELTADILRRNGVTNVSGYLWQHNDWTGKDCPYDIRRGNPYDWNTFVTKVQEKLTPPKPKPKYVKYRAWLQDKKWTEWTGDGEWCGTTHESRRLEAIQIDYDKPVKVKAHIQEKGWVDYGTITKDTIIGTQSQSLRLECLQIEAEGLEFQVHIENYGDSCPTKCDGISTLGSTGESLRIEAIRINKRN